MPCNDGGDIHPVDAYHTRKELEFVEAILCAVLTAIEKRWGSLRDSFLYEYMDFRDAGFTEKQMLHWWDKHKARDAERRKRENEAAQKEKLKKQALAKLTPAERKALGI